MTNLTLRRPAWRSPFTPLFERDRDFFGPSLRRMFDTIEPSLAMEPIGLMPAVEISETDNEFVCATELPGMKQKDVQVMFDDGVLTIKGEKRDEREQKDGKRVHLVERSYGAFERSFTFAGKVDAEKITASFADGVLTVTLPKAPEAKVNTRTIKVEGK